MVRRRGRRSGSRAARSRCALVVGGWFAAFVVTKGTYQYASVDDASIFRIMMPVVSGVRAAARSLVFLVPRRRREPAARPRSTRRPAMHDGASGCSEPRRRCSRSTPLPSWPRQARCAGRSREPMRSSGFCAASIRRFACRRRSTAGGCTSRGRTSNPRKRRLLSHLANQVAGRRRDLHAGRPRRRRLRARHAGSRRAA